MLIKAVPLKISVIYVQIFIMIGVLTLKASPFIHFVVSNRSWRLL